MNYYKKIKNLKQKELNIYNKIVKFEESIPRISKYWLDIQRIDEYNKEWANKSWFDKITSKKLKDSQITGFQCYPDTRAIEADFKEYRKLWKDMKKITQQIEEMEFNGKFCNAKK